jgi:hypothetical protein
MKTMWGYLGGTVVKPRKTFALLAADHRKIVLSFKAMLLIGMLYVLTVVGLSVAGALPFAPPFLQLQPENYYFYEIFFAAPVFLLGWIMASGVLYLLCRAARGKGTFDSAFAALGFAVTVASFVTWLPETVMTASLLLGTTQEDVTAFSAQPGFAQFFVMGYQIVAVFWMCVLASAAAAVTQKVRWWKAILIGLTTTATFMAMMITFIR